MCERVELVEDVLVERGAPEGMPAPVRGLEVGMDKPRGNRPSRDVEHRQDDPRRAAGLDIRRGIGCEVEQLVELEAPRADAVAGVDEIGDRRHPGLQPPRGKRSVGLADERVRARVLLPEDLERRFDRGLEVLRTRTRKHRRDGRRRTGELPLRARDEGRDVLDLLLGEVVLEGRHRAAAVRHLRDDLVEGR